MSHSTASEAAPGEPAPRWTLRAAAPQDREFLLRVYASTREEEMTAWGWSAAQKQAFAQMQFQARELSYKAEYPDAEKKIVMVAGAPAGVLQVRRGEREMNLVDIALLPEYQGRGLGGQLVRQLMEEAARAGVPLRLSVLRTNPAARLYERLGFATSEEGAMYRKMERRPG